MLEITHKELGKLLKAARIKKEVSQEDLSSRLGFIYNVVGTWENGSGRIRAEEMQQLVNLLEIPLNELEGYFHLWSR